MFFMHSSEGRSVGRRSGVAKLVQGQDSTRLGRRLEPDRTTYLSLLATLTRDTSARSIGELHHFDQFSRPEMSGEFVQISHHAEVTFADSAGAAAKRSCRN